MAMKLYSESDIQDIADAIREKNGSNEKYTVAQMAQAIRELEVVNNEMTKKSEDK